MKERKNKINKTKPQKLNTSPVQIDAKSKSKNPNKVKSEVKQTPTSQHDTSLSSLVNDNKRIRFTNSIQTRTEWRRKKNKIIKTTNVIVNCKIFYSYYNTNTVP